MSSRLASTYVASTGTGNGNGYSKAKQGGGNAISRRQLESKNNTFGGGNFSHYRTEDKARQEKDFNKRKGKEEEFKGEDFLSQSKGDGESRIDTDKESFQEIEYLYRSTIANLLVSNQKLATFHEAELECYRGLCQDKMAKKLGITDITNSSPQDTELADLSLMKSEQAQNNENLCSNNIEKTINTTPSTTSLTTTTTATNHNNHKGKNEIERNSIRRKSVGPGLSSFVRMDSKDDEENNLTIKVNMALEKENKALKLKIEDLYNQINDLKKNPPTSRIKVVQEKDNEVPLKSQSMATFNGKSNRNSESTTNEESPSKKDLNRCKRTPLSSPWKEEKRGAISNNGPTPKSASKSNCYTSSHRRLSTSPGKAQQQHYKALVEITKSQMRNEKETTQQMLLKQLYIYPEKSSLIKSTKTESITKTSNQQQEKEQQRQPRQPYQHQEERKLQTQEQNLVDLTHETLNMRQLNDRNKRDVLPSDASVLSNVIAKDNNNNINSKSNIGGSNSNSASSGSRARPRSASLSSFQESSSSSRPNSSFRSPSASPSRRFNRITKFSQQGPETEPFTSFTSNHTSSTPTKSPEKTIDAKQMLNNEKLTPQRFSPSRRASTGSHYAAPTFSSTASSITASTITSSSTTKVPIAPSPSRRRLSTGTVCGSRSVQKNNDISISPLHKIPPE